MPVVIEDFCLKRNKQ